MTFPAEAPSDLQIARKAKPKPLGEVAAGIGIGSHYLEPDAVARVELEAVEELEDRPPARYVVVSDDRVERVGQRVARAAAAAGGISEGDG